MVGVAFVQAWQRPVTAVSGIPFRSETVDILTGVVKRRPGQRYATVDMQPGDRIDRYDGYAWEHAQRLNLHELSGKQAGEHIPIVIQRDGQRLSRQLAVILPDAWEQLVLSRFALAALVCWIPPTVLLATLIRDLRAHPMAQRFPFDASNVPLWVLTWYSVSIAQSVGSLKYPVAFLWSDIFSRVSPMLIALTSLPYLLAPRSHQDHVSRGVVGILSLVTAGAFIWHAAHSPFPSNDWRRAVQLLRPSDAVASWTLSLMVLGIVGGTIGSLLTALAHPLRATLDKFRVRTSGKFASIVGTIVDWLTYTYMPCPPAMTVVAQFQLMINSLYLCFDLLPRTLGGAGGGYSTLFALLPLSYLLMYSDMRARIQGETLMMVLIGASLMIQVPNLVVRLVHHTYGNGANHGDMATILLVGLGSVLGGTLIAWGQRQRWRALADPLQNAIDGLFTYETQAGFWHHLTTHVGPLLGVTTWLWARQVGTHSWEVVEQTPYAHAHWLTTPNVQVLLNSSLPRPREVIGDTTTLPTTLILLPVYRDEQVRDVLIAANPQGTRAGLEVLENPFLSSRLMNAVQMLHGIDRQRQIAEKERLLAQQQQQLAVSYQRLFRQQRNRSQASDTQVSALLHDKALQWLLHLKQTLGTVATDQRLAPEHQALLSGAEQRCTAINTEIRRIMDELRPVGVGQQLPGVLESVISNWAQQERTVTFNLHLAPDAPDLTEFQRNSVFLIVNQAITNALTHAAPTHITITTRYEQQQFVVEVRDDGRGFRHEQSAIPPMSSGLLLMHDLAEELGGKLAIETQPGRGASIALLLPCTREGKNKSLIP